MSDEDLLLKTETPAPPPQPNGASGIQVPMDLLNVSLFGVFKDSEKKDPTSTEEEYVEQKFSLKIPRGTVDEDTAQFVWLKFLQQAALRTVGSAGEISFFPLDRFKRFTVQVGHIHGVAL